MKNVIRFHPDGAVEHVQGTGPNPVSGHPVTHVWRCFVHPSGKLRAGLWSCEGGPSRSCPTEHRDVRHPRRRGRYRA